MQFCGKSTGHDAASADSWSSKSGFGLVAIGVFKLVKSVSLLALGITLLRWRHEDVGHRASDWLDAVWLARPYFDSLISKLSSLNERTIEEVAAGSLIYSVLLLIEGVGLCLRKRWAEFLTVGITASLLPFEFYELFHRLTVIGVVITLVNVAILCYLIVQLTHDHSKKSELPKNRS